MSYWTQVIGNIITSCSDYEKIESIMGKPVHWPKFDLNLLKDKCIRQLNDFYDNIWQPAFERYDTYEDQLPMGSEGSIDWRYIDTNNINESVYGKGSMIAIDGSLRDFGGDEDIRKTINWFIRCCNELNARYGVLAITDELGITDDMSYYYTTVIYEFSTAYVYHNGNDFKEKIQRPKNKGAN